MAEPAHETPHQPYGPPYAPAGPLRAYLVLAGAWVRAAWSYRTSFLLLLVARILISGIDFLAVLVMFTHIDTLGGFDLAAVALLYGLSGLALGFADLVAGNAERLGRRVRDGTLDAMLVRPVSPLVQVCADQFALPRVGRVVQAALVLGWALSAVDVDWDVSRVLVLGSTVIAGATIFTAIFVAGAAYQFVAGDASEAMNVFTYGGAALTQYPLTIFPIEVVRGVTFVVPIAFVNWYPVLYVLDLPDPFGLPGWLRLAAPLVALVTAVLAAGAWRWGLRRYRSTGS